MFEPVFVYRRILSAAEARLTAKVPEDVTPERRGSPELEKNVKLVIVPLAQVTV
jgi:hypothetical protein